MALKKGWEQRKIRENCLGWYFDRWYIKSPAGNFYHLFRQSNERSSLTNARIYLEQDMTESYDPSKKRQIEPIPMGEMIPNYGFKDWDWNRILQELYTIETNGTYSETLSHDIATHLGRNNTYPKTLSDEIKNYPECKELFSQDKKSITINTY